MDGQHVDTFPKTLVVLPALNEAENIARVVKAIRQHIPWADVLVINDGSTDTTGQEATEAGAIVLTMPYRVGIGAGVQTGFQFAAQYGYEVVVRNDGDGQHEPSAIPAFINAVQAEDVDVVIGSRYIEDRGYRASLPRRLGSAILANLLSLIVGQPVTDPTSGFNAFNQRAIHLCAALYPHDYPEPEAIVLFHRAGLTIQEMPVTMKARKGGKSTITVLGSGYFMVKVILAILIDLLRRAPVLDSELN
jgi:glycosyltransferase involved in cell wall biosynthesis